MQNEPTRIHVHKTVPLGELVAAVFDEAALYSDDPWNVSLLATQALTDLLLHTQRKSISLSRPMLSAKAANCKEQISRD